MSSSRSSLVLSSFNLSRLPDMTLRWISSSDESESCLRLRFRFFFSFFLCLRLRFFLSFFFFSFLCFFDYNLLWWHVSPKREIDAWFPLVCECNVISLTFSASADSPSDFAEASAHFSECFVMAAAASSAMTQSTWKISWRLVKNTMDIHSAAT